MEGALVGAGSLWPGFSSYEECDGIASLITTPCPSPQNSFKPLLVCTALYRAIVKNWKSLEHLIS